MHNLRFLINPLLLVLVLSTSGCFISDPCKNVDCGANAVCIEGTCNCDPGYMGADCATIDPCYGVNCVNGTCVNGNCNCDPGYEGEGCDKPFNARYLGAYMAAETCSSSGANTYSVLVTPKSGTVLEAQITGLWGQTQGVVTATILDSNSSSFMIPRQTLYGTYEIESATGSITPDGAEITISYTVFQNGNTVETCTVQLNK